MTFFTKADKTFLQAGTSPPLTHTLRSRKKRVLDRLRELTSDLQFLGESASFRIYPELREEVEKIFRLLESILLRKQESEKRQCTHCHGRGKILSGDLYGQTLIVCPDCRGEGLIGL